MRVALTGGSGFIGQHLSRSLLADGHTVIVVARGRRSVPADLASHDRYQRERADIATDDELVAAFDGCESVGHLAGINRERGTQTYQAVHVDGTNNVVRAAEKADVNTIVLSSYLRARPDCGSGYLESKWTAEERVRAATIRSCILKPPAVFGRGDQFLTGLARWLRLVPIVPTVGIRQRRLRPVAVDDVARVAHTALTTGRIDDTTLALTGPTCMTLNEIVNEVAKALERRAVAVPAPVFTQRVSAAILEHILDPPLVTRAGVRMLAEGMTDPEPMTVCDPIPGDLTPNTTLTPTEIERIVVDTGRYGLKHLRVPSPRR